MNSIQHFLGGTSLKTRKALKLFLINMVQFALIAANFRAVAFGWYVTAAVTDGVICLLGFTLIQSISKAETKLEMFAYSIGGTLGAQFAIFGTKWLFGE